MKKSLSYIVVFSTILIFSSSIIFAQETIQKGIKLGYSLSNINGNDVGDTDSKNGASAGVFIVFDIVSKFSIQTEVQFIQKGWRLPNSDVKIKLNYIEIPILAKLSIIDRKNFGFDLFLGPAISFNQSSKIEIAGDDQDFEVKKTDYAIIIGLNLNYSSFIFDTRFTQGLTSIDDSVSDLDFKNMGVSFLIGFSF